MFRSTCKLNRIRFDFRIPYFVNYATKPVIKEEPTYDHQLKEFEKISKIIPKTRTKKPQKPPFVKNLLIGTVDTDILAYPELEKEDWEQLEKSWKQLETSVISSPLRKVDKWTVEVGQYLSNNQLLGLQVPQLEDGRELNSSETCRLTEVISKLQLRTNVICSEQLGQQLLLKFGDDVVKNKYLKELIKGKSLSAFGIVTSLPSNLDVLGNTAVLSSNGKSWILNGEIKNVVNGDSADLLIVAAQTDALLKDVYKEEKMTLFVVEKSTIGIQSTIVNNVNPNLGVSNIVFEDVEIPKENIIGTIGNGINMIQAIYPNYRLSFGVLCSIINKEIVNKATEHCINISKEPLLLYETDAVREKIAQLLVSTYAIESVTYLTAGLMDTYDNQDCDLEALITKIFAVDQTLQNITNCINLIGPDASVENHWCSQLHKEAISLLNLPEPNDNLKIMLALFGIKYAGQKMNEFIKQLRNPLYNAAFILKRMWTHSRQNEDRPKLNLYLYHHLHPSFVTPANYLEYCVLRLQYAVEILLSRHGNEVVNQHMDLRRIAESLIEIYVMVACVGRASRSYCIGLAHAQYEIALATSYCADAKERVRSNLNKVINGQYFTNDENYRQLAARYFQLKEYYPVHPLSRNF